MFSQTALKKIVFALIVTWSGLAVYACSTSSTSAGEVASNARPQCDNCEILLIGSSYLSYIQNDVDTFLRQFCEAAGKEAYVEMRSLGGWKLSRHAGDSLTTAKINERKWDYVFLQGNAAYPSQEKWHHFVQPYINRLRETIKKNSAKSCVAYMMPWAYLDGLTFLPGETDDYHRMQGNIFRHTIEFGRSMDIVISPVGSAWYEATTADYVPGLYLSDLNHQTEGGAYLTAAVFYSTIYLEKAPHIEYDWKEDHDPDYLRDLAFKVVTDSLDLWNIYL